MAVSAAVLCGVWCSAVGAGLDTRLNTPVQTSSTAAQPVELEPAGPAPVRPPDWLAGGRPGWGWSRDRQARTAALVSTLNCCSLPRTTAAAAAGSPEGGREGGAAAAGVILLIFSHSCPLTAKTRQVTGRKHSILINWRPHLNTTVS